MDYAAFPLQDVAWVLADEDVWITLIEQDLDDVRTTVLVTRRVPPRGPWAPIKPIDVCLAITYTDDGWILFNGQRVDWQLTEKQVEAYCRLADAVLMGPHPLAGEYVTTRHVQE